MTKTCMEPKMKQRKLSLNQPSVAIVDRTPGEDDRRRTGFSSTCRSDEATKSSNDQSWAASLASVGMETDSNGHDDVVMDESEEQIPTSSIPSEETYNGRSPIPNYEQEVTTTTKDGELALLNDSIIVRYSLKVQMSKEYAFKPVREKIPSHKIPRDNFDTWFNKMQELDPTFVILPWWSVDARSFPPIADSIDFRSFHAEALGNYFWRLRVRELLSNKDYLHVDVKVAHTLPTKELLSLAGPWLKARKMGMWPKKLQAENVVCVGYFLFSCREMDLDRFEQELSDAGLGFEVSLRYRTMHPKFCSRRLEGGIWDPNRAPTEDEEPPPKAIHVDVKQSDSEMASEKLTESFDADSDGAFPYVGAMFFIPAGHSEDSYAVAQSCYLCTLRTHRIRGIVGKKVFESSPWFFGGSSFRDWLLKMASMTSAPFRKLFVSMDLAFRRHDKLIITYHLLHDIEARTIIRAIEPFLRYFLSEERFSSCDSSTADSIMPDGFSISNLSTFIQDHVELWGRIRNRNSDGVSDPKNESDSMNTHSADSTWSAEDSIAARESDSTKHDGEIDTSVVETMAVSCDQEAGTDESGIARLVRPGSMSTRRGVNSRHPQEFIVANDWTATLVSEESDFCKTVQYAAASIFGWLSDGLVELQRHASTEQRIEAEKKRLTKSMARDIRFGRPHSEEETIQEMIRLHELKQDASERIETAMARMPLILSAFQQIVQVTDKVEHLRDLLSTSATAEVASRAQDEMLLMCSTFSALSSSFRDRPQP